MKMKKNRIFLCLLAALMCVILGCNNPPKDEINIVQQKEVENPQTRTIVDSMGREVEVPYEINTIVDLGIDATKMLIQLGDEDKIAGLTGRGLWTCNASTNKSSKIKWSIVAEVAPELKNVESVGFSYREIDVEKIAQIKPDVIISPIQTKDKIQAIEEQTGVPVVCISNFYTIDYKALQILAQMMGKEKRANDIINFCNEKLSEIEEVVAKIPQEKKTKVFIIIPTPSSESELDTTANYQPIDLAGMMNVANINKDKRGNFGISKEQVAVWNPDLFLIYGRAMNGKDVNTKYINSVLNDPLLNTTNAIKNSQVYTYPGFDYGWDIATAIIQVPYFAKLAYPTEFKNYNVEKVNNEILEYLYGKGNLYNTVEDTLKLKKW